MAYAPGAVERVMKVQEVILRALSGQLTWLQAADILGRSPRSIRRLRRMYQRYGCDVLFDRRRQTPSPKRAPVAAVEQVLRLYRERYAGFNVRHFWQRARAEHGVTFCYAFVKKALQGAGLVPRHRPRGRHRRRREPRPCFGELLHLDGSRHRWLVLGPEPWQTLIAVVDDATKQVLHAELHAGGESTRAVMTALRAVFTASGVPMALSRIAPTGPPTLRWPAPRPIARASPRSAAPSPPSASSTFWAIPPRPAAAVNVSTAPCRIGSSTSSRVSGIATVPAANRYLRERFLPAFNAEFGRAPADPAPPSCRWAPRISSRSSVTRRSGSLPGTIPSSSTGSSCSSPSSPAAGRVPASGCSSAGILPAPTPFGSGLGAWEHTTPEAGPSRPRPHDSSLTDRPNHGVKQKRSFHLSTTLATPVAIRPNYAQLCPDDRWPFGPVALRMAHACTCMYNLAREACRCAPRSR